METYHKINTLFKRDSKGKMLRDEWSTPELEYLAGNQWEFTEKVDGTNIRVHISRIEDWLYVEYAGRTDKAEIPPFLREHLEAQFPAAKTKFDSSERERTIGNWMVDNDIHDVILFGEGYGPKIQNGEVYRDDVSFVLFDVKIGNFWLSRFNVDAIATALGIDTVPVIGRGTLQDAIDIVSTGITFDSFGSIKRWGRGRLDSQWGDFEAEGIVARPVADMFDRHGNRIITKIKAKDFK